MSSLCVTACSGPNNGSRFTSRRKNFRLVHCRLCLRTYLKQPQNEAAQHCRPGFRVLPLPASMGVSGWMCRLEVQGCSGRASPCTSPGLASEVELFWPLYPVFHLRGQTSVPSSLTQHVGLLPLQAQFPCHCPLSSQRPRKDTGHPRTACEV